MRAQSGRGDLLLRLAVIFPWTMYTTISRSRRRQPGTESLESARARAFATAWWPVLRCPYDREAGTVGQPNCANRSIFLVTGGSKALAQPYTTRCVNNRDPAGAAAEKHQRQKDGQERRHLYRPPSTDRSYAGQAGGYRFRQSSGMLVNWPASLRCPFLPAGPDCRAPADDSGFPAASRVRTKAG